MTTFSDVFAVVAAEKPWLFPTLAAIFGACVGSFLNVCIYRIPKGESVVLPGSHCGCGHKIAWHDNIPVLSWLLLRGRARCCGRAFSFRYPAVEAGTALLFLACAVLFPPGKAFAGMFFVSLIICAVFIDIDHMIIPDVFTVGGVAAGACASVLIPSLHGESTAGQAMISAMLGVFVGSGIILWIAIFAETLLKKEAMGFGDVKLLGAIGAFLGWQGAVFSLFAGALIGCLWFACAVLWAKVSGRQTNAALRVESDDGAASTIGFGKHVSFGPMLGIASLLFLFGSARFAGLFVQ